MFNIDRDKLRAAIDKANLQGELINKKIGKFLQISTLSEQKNLELCQIGKFLTTFEDLKIEIIEHRESPDFIISVDDRKIGLEHERILNTQNVKQIQSIENVFKLAEKEFELKYPNIKLVANCWLETESFTFNQKEKRRVVRQIVDYIFGLTQNVNIEKPDFLCYVDISDHNGVSFSFNGDISNIKSLDSQTLSNAIIKKEALIEKYINNCGIQEQWLILVVGQTSPDSYKINESVLNSTDSRFERIYLFEDFKSKKYRLK